MLVPLVAVIIIMPGHDLSVNVYPVTVYAMLLIYNYFFVVAA